MEIIIILLCVMSLLLIYINLTNNKNKQELNKKLETLMQNQHEEVYSRVKNDVTTKNIQQQFQIMLNQVAQANKMVSASDSNITNMLSKINNINDIMVNTKRRGTFGEYQLINLLSIYCGDSHEIYEPQYVLQNGFIGDVALHLPNSELVMIIDSKFPMENYQNIIKYEDDPMLPKYISAFKTNIKKHINDIATKYISRETSEQAIMFIPSEAVYQYICSECPQLIDESHKKRVLITSPTTLLGVTFTLVNITKDFARSNNIKNLEKTIVSLKENSDRMIERYNKVYATLETSLKQMNELNKSINKITNKINKVYDGYDEQSDVE